MNKKIITATIMAMVASCGSPIVNHKYKRRRDLLPKDIQAEKIKKAQEKRDRKENTKGMG